MPITFSYQASLIVLHESRISKCQNQFFHSIARICQTELQTLLYLSSQVDALINMPFDFKKKRREKHKEKHHNIFSNKFLNHLLLCRYLAWGKLQIGFYRVWRDMHFELKHHSSSTQPQEQSNCKNIVQLMSRHNHHFKTFFTAAHSF